MNKWNNWYKNKIWSIKERWQSKKIMKAILKKIMNFEILNIVNEKCLLMF
jgi:hypothetical protein